MNSENCIGWIMADGKLYCQECAGTLPESGCVPQPVPVYLVNIKPYSQDCHNCGKLIVDGLKKSKGGEPLCVFDKPNR